MSEQGTMNQANVEDRITIPKEQYAPKPEATPDYKPEIKNFADNKETAEKTLAYMRGYLSDFKNQNQRVAYEEQCDLRDELYRAAVNRVQLDATEDKNVEDTRSKVKSSSFHSDIRAITASEKVAILGNEEELPVEYEPYPGSEEYKEAEGIRMAEHWNAILAYTMQIDNMREKIGSTLLKTNKYGNVAIEMAWDYRKEEIIERVPVFATEPEAPAQDMMAGMGQPPVPEMGQDMGMGQPPMMPGMGIEPEAPPEAQAEPEEEERRPIGFDFVSKEKVIADNPTLIIHDIKDCYFDTQIEKMQDQSCVITRTQKQIGDIWQLQATNQFKNVGKIKTSQRYTGEGESEVKDNRQSNAGEDGDSNTPTSLFDLWPAWIRIPVNTETGKWNAEKEMPTWFRATYAGSVESGNVVCLQITPNPNKCKRIPMELVHSHEDDKGAIHLGYGDLVKSILAQEMTSFDQFIDNNTERNQAPMIVERGSLAIRDKVYSAAHNRIWFKRAGSQDPHIVQVQDTTNNTNMMLGLLSDARSRAMGLNKPLLGEASGSRTSASEATIDYEQALKPALEDAKYKARQILVFVAFWIKEMWEQFGDPERTIAITYKDNFMKVQSSRLWGDMNIRIVSVKKFQDDMIQRKETDHFFQVMFPMMQPLMSPEGQIQLFTYALKQRDIPQVDNIWAVDQNTDAKHVARSENYGILIQGVYDMPKPGEKHKVHLPEHKAALATYSLLSKEERNEQNYSTMKQHVMQTESLIEQEAQQAALPPAGMPGGGPGSELQGNVLGGEMGAQAGAMEEPAADVGRQPTAEGAL